MSSPPSEPSEEELRAAYEAELKRVKVSDVVLQTAVSLINLAGRRAGLAPGSEDERDLAQVADAIEAVRALMPILERSGAAELAPLRNALSQLQMVYAKERGSAAPEQGGAAAGSGGAGDSEPGATAPDESGAKPKDGSAAPGPAQSSGRLWVPGS